MPTISMFFGSLVHMYLLDDKQHNLPHIHVVYAEAAISILDGEVLGGELPKKQLKLVQAWIEIHAEELIADWSLAVSGQPPYKTEPMR